MTKLYKNEEWLRWAYHGQKYTPAKIATLAGTSQQTVYRYLRQYNLIKKEK